MTKAIENVTSRTLPSDLFLATAIISMLGSAVLQASGKRDVSVFVGQWAPTLLILGLYNKLVKLQGSE